MEDKRKNNGGNSTKSKKAYDRRKKISISNNDSVNGFCDKIKEDMMVFYEASYKGFLKKHLKHGKYYVYFHYYNNEIVYIGKGFNERAFNWNSRANKEHLKLLKENKLEVKIIANNLENDIAFIIEASLIDKYNPKYNGGQKKE